MAHQVVVLLTRYVVEGMDEQTVLEHRPRGRGRQLRGHLVRARRRRRPPAARALQRGRPARGAGRARHRRTGRAPCPPLSRPPTGDDAPSSRRAAAHLGPAGARGRRRQAQPRHGRRRRRRDQHARRGAARRDRRAARRRRAAAGAHRRPDGRRAGRLAARGDGPRPSRPTTTARCRRDGAEALVDALGGAGTVVLGPGLSGKTASRGLLARLLPRSDDDATLVLDAVALTALAGPPSCSSPWRGRVVLTPNSGELAALLEGERARRAGRSDAGRRALRRCRVGAAAGSSPPTAAAGALEAGGIGLGTSGSGDVLAGLVGGMLARGARPDEGRGLGAVPARLGRRPADRPARPDGLPRARAARRGARRAGDAAPLTAAATSITVRGGR